MTIEVRTDDRLRLVGVLLAASDWPEFEQHQKPYKAHRVADAAHKYFAPHRERSAAKAIRLLAGSGEGLPAMFAYALNQNWPDDFLPRQNRFLAAANPLAFFLQHQSDFAQAEADATAVLARADLGNFLNALCGKQSRSFTFVPNLLYPGHQSVAASSATEIVVTAPPPIAWGTSNPWRYSERPDEALAIISEAFARFLFAEVAPAQADVLGLAAAVLFLREAEGPDAGDQFMVMEKKTRGLKQLPAVVASLENILAERRAGNYPHGISDYVHQFSS